MSAGAPRLRFVSTGGSNFFMMELLELVAAAARDLGADAELAPDFSADAPDVDNQVRFTGPADSRERGFVNVRIDRAEPYDLDGHVEAR